jgi:ribosome biogenesis GTPase
MTSLRSLGWNDFFARQVHNEGDAGLEPARVVEEQRERYRVLTPHGEFPAVLAGRLRHAEAEGALLPCVGDWVLQKPAGDGPGVIQRVLERRSRFARRAAGRRSDEQVVAANADTVFVVQSLNRDLNLRRLERYLALLWESGARPVVLLSKADLCPDADAAVRAVREVAAGVPVHVTSAVTADGLDPIRPYLVEGETVVLVGSSGVGKSSLMNRLLGQPLMVVKAVRADDDRGRHTTTYRKLVPLPDGGLLMDTPGMRTVLLTEGEAGVAGVFEDVAALAAGCRFGDCTHQAEPGCAVRAAVEEGRLDAGRLRSHHKLVREERYEAGRHDRAIRQAEARRWKIIHKANRARPDKRAGR